MITTKEEYDNLKASGFMWEFHPDFTGEWEIDKIKILNKDMSDNQNIFPEKPVLNYGHPFDIPVLDIRMIEQPDLVNEPPHYKQGRTEVFDQMLKLFGKEAVMNYCEINAFKYRMRAGYKSNIEEDIKKAMWYDSKLKELMNEVGRHD